MKDYNLTILRLFYYKIQINTGDSPVVLTFCTVLKEYTLYMYFKSCLLHFYGCLGNYCYYKYRYNIKIIFIISIL